MNLLNKIIIKYSCSKVGSDEFGNEYFERKNADKNGKKKRFVIYNGLVEASKVPSNWHVWLHYTVNKAPIHSNTHRNPWQKTHLPNLTGTIYNHSPAIDKKNNKLSKSSVYESWNPEE
ncbi:NADH-ubiquinone oxidoreductase subunit NDUFA12 family protein [Rickettsiales bacterium]|mgnify:CR=1 FL=1|nr:NADH-ubiquinone oxidoreductase subunit NDUFA12 family protein [Rickettsiales bacterium]